MLAKIGQPKSAPAVASVAPSHSSRSFARDNHCDMYTVAGLSRREKEKERLKEKPEEKERRERR